MTRSLTFCAVAIVFMVAGGARLALAQTETQDVDALLKKADAALSGAPSQQSSTPRPQVVKPKNSAKVADIPGTDADNEPVTPPVEMVPVLRPVRTASIEDMVAIEKAAKAKEHDYVDPRIFAEFAAGFSTYSAGTQLIKDEDQFTFAAPATLTGGQVSLSSQWRPFYESPDEIPQRFVVDTTVGHFSGASDSQRRGITTSDRDYDISATGVELGIGYFIGWQGVAGVKLVYGLGGELLYQRGDGETDTTSEIFSSDRGTVELQSLFSNKFILFGRAQYRDIGLWQRADKASRGTVFAFGFGIPLAG